MSKSRGQSQMRKLKREGKFKYDRSQIWQQYYAAYKYYYDKKNNLI